MLLPTKVAIASGCVIDSFGATSSQADVVVHERDNCPVFSINGAPEATYIPCEGAVAVGEIKSTLNAKELKDSVAKLQKVKELKRAIHDRTCFRQYGTGLIMQGAESEAYNPANNVSDQTYTFVLCQNFGISQETLTKHYAGFCGEKEAHLAPNIVLSLAEGIMMFADEKGMLLRNAAGARHVAFFKHPGGDFQFLLSEIIHACNKGRTTDVLPYAQYILGAHIGASVRPTYCSIA